MASVNKIHLLGHAGRDAEVRYLPSGKAMASFSLATSSRRKDKDGNAVEDTQWHRVQMFDKLAEIAGEYIKKGKPVYIEGRIKYGKYTNKDGVEQNTCDIVATEMQLLGGRDEGQQQAPRAAPRPAPAKPAGSGFDDIDQDIPW